MKTTATSIVLVFALAGASPAAPVSAAAARPASAVREVRLHLLDLASARRLYTGIARQRRSMSEGERVAAWTDFSLLAEAVLGRALDAGLSFDDVAGAMERGEGPQVVATPGVALRDSAAYQLMALGYSAQESADVVSARISQHALDTARKLLVTGRGREMAANYLDEQYKRVLAFRRPAPPAMAGMRVGPPSQFDSVIDRYAQLHNIDAGIVRAVIRTESGFNPAARSPKGAVGLMQLMPATARELGVNPWVPEQNIEGGVRYLSALLKMFGKLELALVAYNGGPGYAQRYARGQAVLYGETRDYVKRVLARIAGSR